jgi:hypothetical protein
MFFGSVIKQARIKLILPAIFVRVLMAKDDKFSILLPTILFVR